MFYSEYYFVRAGIYGILIHPREQWAFREAQEHKEDRGIGKIDGSVRTREQNKNVSTVL